MITVGTLLKDARGRYPYLLLPHVRVLLESHTGQSAAFLLAHPEHSIPSEVSDRFWRDVRRLSEGEPLSRVVGRREFWGHDFFLSPDTLDPRPDSETLIEAVLDYYPHRKNFFSFIDLGTGSGCLLISLLKEYPCGVGLGVDYSLGALETAHKNARVLGVAGRVRFEASNWWESVEGAFDVVVSNPPYIRDSDYEKLDPIVRDYDPCLALKGGEDGLNAYRTIIYSAPMFLKPHSHLFLEVGWDQAVSVSKLLVDRGFLVKEIRKDLAQNDRILVASWRA